MSDSDGLSIVLKNRIKSQLEKYYPSRVEDYLNGLLDIKFEDLNEKNQIYFNQLKESSGKQDEKDCYIILGFETGKYFAKKEELYKEQSMLNELDMNENISSLKKSNLLDTNKISDGYHTFGELYKHRMAFNAALAKVINLFVDGGDLYAYKSKKHHDGTMFDGMFIVVIESPIGQISYHYDLVDWDVFDLPEKEQSLEWDGHTPDDSIARLMALFTKRPNEKVVYIVGDVPIYMSDNEYNNCFSKADIEMLEKGLAVDYTDPFDNTKYKVKQVLE